jgi:uncharacterized membrane protein (UPF0127 family)
LALAILGALALASGCQGTPPAAQSSAPSDESRRPQRLPAAVIRVGDVPLAVEVASTRAQLQKGMMFREKIGPDEAMLFVLQREDDQAFWMKNTLVDLDLAYIQADGTIFQIEPMTARNVEPVWSRLPARYALEVPAGWFEAHGVRVGMKVTIPPEAAEAKD